MRFDHAKHFSHNNHNQVFGRIDLARINSSPSCSMHSTYSMPPIQFLIKQLCKSRSPVLKFGQWSTSPTLKKRDDYAYQGMSKKITFGIDLARINLNKFHPPPTFLQFSSSKVCGSSRSTILLLEPSLDKKSSKSNLVLSDMQMAESNLNTHPSLLTQMETRQTQNKVAIKTKQTADDLWVTKRFYFL